MKKSRVFKFRAWDEKKKLMYSNEECLVNGFNPMKNQEDVKRKLEWMQYAGVEDMNGKEIYEGDIICTIYKIKGKAKRSPSRIVKWNQLQNKLGFNLNENIRGNLKGEKTRYKIIGNIYENSILLI